MNSFKQRISVLLLAPLFAVALAAGSCEPDPDEGGPAPADEGSPSAPASPGGGDDADDDRDDQDDQDDRDDRDDRDDDR